LADSKKCVSIGITLTFCTSVDGNSGFGNAVNKMHSDLSQTVLRDFAMSCEVSI